MVEQIPVLKHSEFLLFQKMIYEAAGINLADSKKALVTSRLAKRLTHFGLTSYGDYFQKVTADINGERQKVIDLLTTNETFFFREPKHFDFLRDKVLPTWRTGARRLWSAASSSGEEAYTLAMLLAEHSPVNDWGILGTDISTRILEKARAGHYPMERAEKIPRNYLTQYCLKGVGPQQGTFIISPELRKRVQFTHANLKTNLSGVGMFDVIFLRNVMIYFDMKTKQDIVSRLLKQLKPGGYLMVGHSESLQGITNDLRTVQPSVYQLP